MAFLDTTLPRPTSVRRLRPVCLALLAGSLLTVGAVQLTAADAAPVATDSFTRTVTAGWGTATSGTPWTLRGTADRFTVSGGTGAMSLTTDGHRQSADLLAVSSSDTDLRATVSADRLPTGTGLFLSLTGRRTPQGSEYAGKVRLQEDGSVALSLVRHAAGAETVLSKEIAVPGLRLAAGTPVRTRVQVTGTAPTTLRAKAWAQGAAEPTSWLVTALDATAGLQVPGAVGVNGYLSRLATNGPVLARFDDVAVTAGSAPSAPAPSAPTPTVPVPSVPAPTAAPIPPPVEEPADVASRPAASAGSVPVGAAQYPVPAGARFVAPTGSDTAAGTLAAPYRTVGRAVVAAPAGSTVVLRAGTYHESVTVPSTKRLALQAYPGEAVWFDGSVPVTGWVPDGTAWRQDGWTATFDASPTYTSGAVDGTQPSWSFVNAAHPMAAHPDQVFVDGRQLEQVGSRAAVAPGRFFVDTVRHQLFVGTDPSGRSVRSSDLTTAVSLRSAGSALRGIGVRRYATSVPLMGSVRVLAPGATLEDVVVTDSASTGVFIGARTLGGTDVTVRRVTADHNGLMGIGASYADGLKASAVAVTGNNTEHFNPSPSAGGFKITKSRGVSVTDSLLADNAGTGLWMDESTYDVTVTGNDVLRNSGNGISFEISAKGRFVDNLVVGSGSNGLKMNDVSDVTLWNNTVVGTTGRAVWLVQDRRLASDLSVPGRDPRRPVPDPTMTWVLGPVTVRNNVLSATTVGCLLCVQDAGAAPRRSAEAMGVTADGNVYAHTGTAAVRWERGSGLPPAVFATAAAFRLATAQEDHGLDLSAPLDAGQRPSAALLAAVPTAAVPLDLATATVTGRPVGTRYLGAWTD